LARAPLRDTDPAQVGRYRLTARLGAGGMGVVYLGTARDGTLVAVKVLRPELTDDPEFRNRFGREVANLTRVKGVCTVRVIEADTDSAVPFMVTEYVSGPSLSEYVARYGRPGPDMMYGLATGLAEALTAIHAAGVVHRDLKPSNVILGQDGPKVIDFGIAQALDATSVTRTGMMVGSAGFMAPEQVTGRAGQAADIFAWAVTLTYAASGQMPFGTGSSDAILYRILHIEPDTTAVPELLRPLVEAALAKDPQRRPRAEELLARLTTRTRADRDYEFNTQAVLAQTWPVTEATPVPPPTSRSLLLEPAPPRTREPRKRVVSRRLAAVGGPVGWRAARADGWRSDHRPSGPARTA
jgi:eukaryotic-like serine/threonine-protein kinase